MNYHKQFGEKHFYASLVFNDKVLTSDNRFGVTG